MNIHKGTNILWGGTIAI